MNFRQRPTMQHVADYLVFIGTLAGTNVGIEHAVGLDRDARAKVAQFQRRGRPLDAQPQRAGAGVDGHAVDRGVVGVLDLAPREHLEPPILDARAPRMLLER